jgi:hypothetical protein
MDRIQLYAILYIPSILIIILIVHRWTAWRLNKLFTMMNTVNTILKIQDKQIEKLLKKEKNVSKDKEE